MTLHGLFSFIQNNIIPLVIIVIGVIMLTRSHNGDHKSTMTTAGVLLIGLAVVGLAINGNAAHLGSRLASLLFG